MRSPTLVAILAAAASACSGSDARTTPPGAHADQPLAIVPASPRVTPVKTLFAAASTIERAQPITTLAPPYSLTASDGSGLTLTRIDARAVVEGPLAFTELHLYFHNPEGRTREGTFAITLPEHAAVSRFAMETDGRLVEAEVVEKQLARRAYEDFLHRRQDPALLEKAAGNQFSARVFPIPANGDKHVVIAFSQEVSPGRYALPLRGLAKTDRVDARVQVRGKDGDLLEQTFAQRAWVPDRDLVIDATALAAPATIAAGDLVATRLPIALQQQADVPDALTILVDTSASRALGFAAAARAVEELAAELARAYGGALPIQIVAFDQTAASIYSGRADGAAAAGVATALVRRGAFGASDLGQALTWIGDHAPAARVVVITDGVVTAGAPLADLATRAKALGTHGVARLDVALAGGIRDEASARALARALPRAGAVLDLDRGTPEVARRVGLAVATDVPVKIAGATWVYPATLPAVQTGDEVTVYARRDPQAPALVADLAGVKTTLTPVGAEPAFVERAIAGAEIADLEARLATAKPDEAAALRATIVKKSTAARVVSDETAMLVLESDADYARYGIDRAALADILELGPHGVELAHRGQQIAQPATPPTTTTRPRPPMKKPTMARAEEIAKTQAALSIDGVPPPPKVSPGAHTGGGGAPPADKADRADQSEALDALDTATAEAKPAPMEREVDEKRKDFETPAAEPAPRAPSVGAGSAYNPSMSRRPAIVQADERVDPMARDDRDDGDDDGLSANRNKPSLTGPLAEIEHLLRTGNADAALAKARAWQASAPGDVLALIGLGDALEASKDLETAARVYGSIIDLYPARADFRRFAGERLERLGAVQRALVIDTYRRAVAERPDHLTGHRLLAYALLQDGQYAEAFDAILAAIDQPYPPDRFAGAERVLADDAGMLGAAYLAHGGKRDAITEALAKRHATLATTPSTRFIMYWETDANDVDFHIRDGRGGHAWYGHRELRSGGELYADITTGYGPECFAIPGRPNAGPYQLSINYYSQGPMGYGMGLLQIQKFDGKGGIAIEDRPYVIMVDQAFVDLGSYKP